MATLTLAKFMTISNRYCQQHLVLFLAIMEQSSDAIIRSNMVVAFGDICHSFNRTIEAHITCLLSRLQDPDQLVRRNAMMVLTHLSLTGMIKVRGQMGEIAKCLEDKDGCIRDLAKMFFSELAGKDSTAIYNFLPDIITALFRDHSDDGSPKSSSLSAEQERILKFLFEFVKKDRQLESLVEKLCFRLRQSDDLLQQRSISHCLSLLPLSTSDKAIAKMIDAHASYKEKLADPIVHGHFVEILGKLRVKAEMKELIERWGEAVVNTSEVGGIVKDMRRMSIINENKSNQQQRRNVRK